MIWRVGLDEAGLGPNLGPMVMASTACRVPDDTPGSLWEHLAWSVRRKGDGKDDRIVIDDSKKVHALPDGLACLERVPLAILPQSPATFGDWLSAIGLGTSFQDLRGEAWFQAERPMPVHNSADLIDRTRTVLREAAAAAGVEWGPTSCVIIPTPRFNDICDQWKNKSGVSSFGVLQLLRQAVALPGSEPVSIAVDRLGGRQYYAPMLSEAFPTAWPIPERETPELCEYRMEGLPRDVRITFEPRADGSHLNVALASMVAKTIREICMMQFNAFWGDLVPDLPPTAGYPLDAGRFLDAIRETMEAEGIPLRDVWRSR
jgi:hypothetical protein